MDFSLTEEQNMLKDQARKFLEKECTLDHIHKMEEDEKGYSTAIWQEMGEFGWLGIPFPEEYGGLGLGFFELAIIFEEMGRVLLPTPFLSTIILGGFPILNYGSANQKSKMLPKIARGEFIMTMALNEPDSWWGDNTTQIETVFKDDHNSIYGTKLFVPNASISDFILCPARTDEGFFNMFCIKKDSPNIEMNLLKSISSQKHWEVIFNNERVSKDDIIGEINQGREIMEKTLEYAAAGESAFMLGGAEKVLEMTVKYATERIQFGRPIGSFQALQHKMAEMHAYIEGMRYAVYNAAWRLNEGLPSKMEISIAKAWAGQVYRRVCADAMQIHGSIGLTKEYALEAYYRHAKVSEIFFGDNNFHKEIIAKAIES